jgi:hypothetical protein
LVAALAGHRGSTQRQDGGGALVLQAAPKGLQKIRIASEFDRAWDGNSQSIWDDYVIGYDKKTNIPERTAA